MSDDFMTGMDVEGLDSFGLLTKIYELGLGCGLWRKEEVIQWCDKVIEAKDSPPYEVIEVSLMSKAKIDDIEGKLFEISKEADRGFAAKLLLSVIHEKLKRNQLKLDAAIKCSTRLLVQTGLCWENEYYNLYSLEDSYELAIDDVHFHLSDVVDTYMEELVKYSNYFDEFQKLYFVEMNSEWTE